MVARSVGNRAMIIAAISCLLLRHSAAFVRVSHSLSHFQFRHSPRAGNRGFSSWSAEARRTIVVGDVHGCREELEDLLAKTNYRFGKDQLIFVGDIVAKGPDSVGCVKIAQELNAIATMGNHEAKVLRDGPSNAGNEHNRIYEELSLKPELLKYVRDMPPYFRIREMELCTDEGAPAKQGILIVHAGLLPGTRPEDNKAADLMHMRNVIDLPDGEAREGVAWAKRWEGPELVIFGHDAKRGLQLEQHAVGLDTGCVYGGELSALLLPTREVVSVPARAQHVPIVDKTAMQS